MFLHDYMAKLGFTSTESAIFLAVYKYGPKPASTIAATVDLDRTYCYKVIQAMLRQKLLSETVIKGTKHFFVPSSDVLLAQVTNKKQELTELEDDFAKVKAELQQYDTTKLAYAPQVVIFDGLAGIERLYEDMLTTIYQRKLITIKFFASHTFQAQVAQAKNFAQLHEGHIDTLVQRRILFDGTVGNGILVMESLDKTDDPDTIKKTSPGLGSTHGYVVGKSLYMIQWRDVPLGFKLDSPDMADMLRFLLERAR